MQVLQARPVISRDSISLLIMVVVETTRVRGEAVNACHERDRSLPLPPFSGSPGITGERKCLING